MHSDHMLQPGHINSRDEMSSLVIVQVTQLARYPLLNPPWVGPDHQPVEIVVAFDDERIAGCESFLDMRSNVPGVSEYAETPVPVIEYELAWLPGIVRDRHWSQGQFADLKLLVAIE
jgi:hypothetical protein